MKESPETQGREVVVTTPLPRQLHPHLSSTAPWERGGLPRQSRNWYMALVGLLLIALALITIALTSPVTRELLPFGAAKSSDHPTPPLKPGQIVGHVFFESSGQSNGFGSQGVADEVQISLRDIPQPAPGMGYYAWILPDQGNPEGQAKALGELPVNGGSVDVLYQGDPLHSNLLLFAGSFLVTEERASDPPLAPSLDRSTWRYSAEFPQTPNPSDAVHHYSLLSHLRHLLAEDPTLAGLGLHGGLDIWFYRNTQMIYEWAGSARDDQKPGGLGLMRSLLLGVVDYLDSAGYVKTELPGAPVAVDPRIAQVGLLQSNPSVQNVPSYLTHIGEHLRGVLASPGATLEQRSLATQIDAELNDVGSWLKQVHADALQLLGMSDGQLLQAPAHTLLDHMVTQAQYAFIGQYTPSTGTTRGGATQIHFTMLRLATLPVTVSGT